MKLHAISDLHVGFAALNAVLLEGLGDHGDDWDYRRGGRW